MWLLCASAPIDIRESHVTVMLDAQEQRLPRNIAFRSLDLLGCSALLQLRTVMVFAKRPKPRDSCNIAALAYTGY
jgi:hypothetical protein